MGVIEIINSDDAGKIVRKGLINRHKDMPLTPGIAGTKEVILDDSENRDCNGESAVCSSCNG